MNERLADLEQHRAALSAEIAEHRVQIARAAQRLHGPLQRVDRIREEVRFVRQNYLFLLLPVALLAVLNPGRAVRLAAGALAAWRAVSRALQPPPRLP